jgi:dolichyl-phosphate-mannose-protein mannosyltransferase
LLSIVFFAVAVPNLGFFHVPLTETRLAAGQSIDLGLGSSINVQSVVLLVKSGSIDALLTTDSQNNYPASVDNASFSNRFHSQWFAERCEVNLGLTCQHIKIIFNQNCVINEIAVIDQTNQKIVIKTITSAAPENADLRNLTDEQTSVEYPSTFLTNQYFDEDFEAESAVDYLHNQIPIEWLHPPLGKIIIASGISVFGLSPFGWRIMGVIFGALMIPLIYFLGKKLFDSWIGGFSAAFLLTFDFMHFTMARMGLTDTYLVFFSLASQLFFLIYLRNMLKDGWATSIVPLFLAFLFFSFSFSTNWTSLFGFAAELIVLAALRFKDVIKLKANLLSRVMTFFKRPFLAVCVFVGFAVLVYFLTYIPDMLAGRSISDVINLQSSILNFHSGSGSIAYGDLIISSRISPFTSPWYSWPLLVSPFESFTTVPLLLSLSLLPNQFESLIVVLGNPAVWWIGFASIISLIATTIFKFLKKAAKKTSYLPVLFILVFFFFQWVPFAFLSRDTFIYHFYLDVPFLILASTYFINKLWKYKWGKTLAIIYFAVTVGLFILFYPIISGAPTSISNINNLHWFSSWQFAY